MSDKQIAPCPNPECSYDDVIVEGCDPTPDSWCYVNCHKCGYGGPSASTEAEAIRLHNAICSSIPRAQIEALEAEMRSHAEQEMESDRKFWTRSMRLDCKVEMECADRLRALLHPELKGEDNND